MLWLEVVQVNGSTKDSDKDHIRKAFNAGLIDVLIGQMQAMGVSWNIQKASSHVVIAEEHPSPSTIEQFYKRVFRYGQENPVQLDFVTADVSIDEILRGVRLRKKASDLKING
jgi:SNF2 family DNA or RNA helicase